MSRLYNSLLIIPKIYPAPRTNKNTTLFPLVERDFSDFQTLAGQAAPKQSNIPASKILIYSSVREFYTRRPRDCQASGEAHCYVRKYFFIQKFYFRLLQKRCFFALSCSKQGLYAEFILFFDIPAKRDKKIYSIFFETAGFILNVNEPKKAGKKQTNQKDNRALAVVHPPASGPGIPRFIRIQTHVRGSYCLSAVQPPGRYMGK
jgi:hypothetical protein